MSTGGKRPSAGTVIGTIALVAAMSGAAYAGGSGKLVGSSDLKNGAVTAPKLHTDSVTTSKIADDAVNGAKVKESSLGPVPFASKALNILAVTVRSDGTLTRSSQQGSSSARNGAGSYTVDFGLNIQACTYIASLGGLEGEPSGEISTSISTANAVAVQTHNSNGVDSDRAFSMIVVC
jgi:hypothetical protein